MDVRIERAQARSWADLIEDPATCKFLNMLLLQSRELIGIGVNCTPPRFVPNLISSAAEVFKEVDSAPLLIAYPNSGEGWINKTGKWDGDSDLQGKDLGAVGLSWRKCGAQVIGGCCRTTPEYITSLAEALS